MTESTEERLNRLRETVRVRLSEKRCRHTLAVEDMAARLCALYCPEETEKLRAAAFCASPTLTYGAAAAWGRLHKRKGK